MARLARSGGRVGLPLLGALRQVLAHPLHLGPNLAALGSPQEGSSRLRDNRIDRCAKILAIPGPVISIALPQPFTEQAEARLDCALLNLAERRLETTERGFWDLFVEPSRLGITATNGEGPRPFLLEVSGVGYQDGDHFDQGRFAEPESDYLPSLLGFTPTNMINVIAMCNSKVDHVATALLTAAITDITGGTANVELLGDQIELARTLTGVLHVAPGTAGWGAFALGASMFLRTFAATPDFRLLK